MISDALHGDGALMRERPAMFGWEMKPDGLAFFDRNVDRRYRAHRFATGQRNEIIPMRTEIDLTRDSSADPVGLRDVRPGRRQADIVMPDRHRGFALRREIARFAAQNESVA